MSEKLKPCKWCGFDDQQEAAFVGMGEPFTWRVMCRSCGALGPEAITKLVALMAWNKPIFCEQSAREGFEGGVRARAGECQCYVKGDNGDSLSLDAAFKDWLKERGK